MLLLILKIIAFIILIICLGFIAYWAVAVIKGDAVMKVLKTKKTPLKVETMDRHHVTLSYTIPIKNVGKQLGTVMDAFVRIYLPFEQYDDARVTGHLDDFDVPRHDDYWQAYIVEPGKEKRFYITLDIDGKGTSILGDLENLPEFGMDIIYQIVARSDYYYAKTRIVITREEVQNALYEYTTEAGK
jgi:hypothetical protein